MTTRRPNTKLIRPLVLALTLAGVPAAAVSSASTSAAATCATTTARWGSLAKSLGRMTEAPITNVHAGRHACFDRMVVDIRGRGAGFRVAYLKGPFRSQGEGAVIRLRGGARLEAIVLAPTNSPRLNQSRELVNVTGFRTFRQIAAGGSFEGQTAFGIGVRARLPMRAFIINGPGTGSRVVIDVAHRW
jgi:hypothetical protein